ncbi:MAG TPA: hypothetical protein VF017_07390 [Thermoanaerobaculia bacterium]|nr:hypothetical protein [Thermoanaerobaculia bacterium]
MSDFREEDLLEAAAGQLDAPRLRQLDAACARDPHLAAERARVERLWRSLEPASPSRVPFGFATRVTARAFAERSEAFSLRMMPGWVRLGAASALIAGVALGVGAGWLRGAAGSAAGLEPTWTSDSWAESYLDELEQDLSLPEAES